MTRWTYRYEVDDTKDKDIIDKVDDLKSGNKYAPAVRDGLRVMHNIIIEDDLGYLLSNDFLNKYGRYNSVKDLKRALNLILAIEQMDIEMIFNLYPGLIQPMVMYSMNFTGMANFVGQRQYATVEPSQQDSILEPQEIPFDRNKAIQSLLS